jgi:glycosyltransferase involved in cell wall biosynthesis
MRILLIHTYYALRGGEDFVFEEEASLLSKTNEVETLAFYNKGGWLGAIQFIFSVWNIFASNKVKKKINKFKPDVIHIHNWHYASGPLVIRTIKKLGIPLIVTLHNFRLLCPSAIFLHKGKIFTESLNKNFPWTAIKKRVYRNSYLQTFWLSFVVWTHKKLETWNKVDKYIVLTKFSKEMYCKSGINISKEKFIVKQNFALKNTSDCLTKHKVPEFLYIGRLSKEKGIDCLLEAFSKVNYIINIGGDGPLKDEVIRMSKSFSNIKYLGKLSKEKVIDNMQRIEILILPTLCYEGMPMTIIEAFSTGLSVIASNLGTISFMIEDGYNGLLFEAGNPDSLISKLEEWYNKSKGEKDQFSKNAYDTYLKHYTPEKNYELIMEIYNQAINDSK